MTKKGTELVVSNGQFADDALFALSRSGATFMTQVFSDVATDFGLNVNFTKTKYQAVGYGLSTEDQLPLVLRSSSISHVESFKYLGSVVTSDGPSMDICQRLVEASRAFGCLRGPVFRDSNLLLHTK